MYRATELSHRSDAKELAALAGTPEFRELLQAESDVATWRLV
jgi:hypothetical protein